MTVSPAPPYRLVAIIAAFNEEDIIGPAIAHLIEQGAGVYLLDDGSTDGTVAVASEFDSKGLIAVESLARPTPPNANTFCWSRILERKAQLAQTLDAEWFIHQDADEFRESPWPHLSLADAVALVDRLGWNAIDFDVFDFVPDNQEFRTGDDPRQKFRCCRPAAEYNRLQIRCWKKTAEEVDLVSSGGHEAIFEERRVFPIRFPMRHYPLRSAAHAWRKVNVERRPRFDPAERARGWHVQYDRFVEGGPMAFGDGPVWEDDAEVVRVAAQVANRLVECAGISIGRDDLSHLAEGVGHLGEAVSKQRTAQADSEAKLSEAESHLLELTESCRREQQENAALRAAHADGQAKLSEAQSHLQELTGSLGREQEENAALRAAQADSEARLREAESHLKALMERLDREQTENVALGAANETLRQDLERLQHDATDLSKQLAEVFASKSWRVTGPLRAIWRILGGR